MNIFVAKLSFRIKEEQLKELFDEFGSVESAKIIIDKTTGRSKGFGFVEMPDETEALNAIENLNDKEIEGRNIVVKQANPKSSQD